MDPGISSDIITVTCSFFSKKVQAKCQERASRGSDQLEFDAVIDAKADFLGFNATYFALFMDWFGMLMEAQWEWRRCIHQMDDEIAAVRFWQDRTGSLSVSFSGV